MTSHPPHSVHVSAPARLHLGFLDLNGGLGRRFGSLGLTIDTFETGLHAERAGEISAVGPQAERISAIARAFARGRGLTGGARFTLERVIPAHAGLGSGTQLALAVGTAFERLYGLDSGAREVARTLDRGRRSGIGIGAFEDGGFIVDAGRGDLDEVPPVALRLEFPAAWRILLLFDNRGQGLHGPAEREAFARLPEFPEASAAHLCRILLMKLVPGLLEARLPPVAEAVGEIQRVVGGHFAPAQGGCFASPAVAEALHWLESQGMAGCGQSSWGPTGFAILEDERRAGDLVKDIRRRFGELSPLRCQTVAARNLGATVRTAETPLCLKEGR
jgi:beta-RFAP synthase